MAMVALPDMESPVRRLEAWSKQSIKPKKRRYLLAGKVFLLTFRKMIILCTRIATSYITAHLNTAADFTAPVVVTIGREYSPKPSCDAAIKHLETITFSTHTSAPIKVKA